MYLMDTNEHWGATYVQSGTNERLNETAPTRKLLDLKLFGQAYAAKPESVQYYRFKPGEEKKMLKRHARFHGKILARKRLVENRMAKTKAQLLQDQPTRQRKRAIAREYAKGLLHARKMSAMKNKLPGGAAAIS